MRLWGIEEENVFVCSLERALVGRRYWNGAFSLELLERSLQPQTSERFSRLPDQKVQRYDARTDFYPNKRINIDHQQESLSRRERTCLYDRRTSSFGDFG